MLYVFDLFVFVVLYNECVYVLVGNLLIVEIV